MRRVSSLKFPTRPTFLKKTIRSDVVSLDCALLLRCYAVVKYNAVGEQKLAHFLISVSLASWDSVELHIDFFLASIVTGAPS